MARPKFYLEPRPSKDGKQAINLFFSFNGNRLQYYTGIRIDIKYFRPECNTSDSINPIKSLAPSAKNYNNKLKDMAVEVVRIENEAKGPLKTVKYIREQLDLIYKPNNEATTAIIDLSPTGLIALFTKTIEDTISGKRVITKGKNIGARYSANTIKNYKTTLASLKRYAKSKRTKDIDLVNVDLDFYSDYKLYCFNKENKEISTFAGFIKDIKTIMIENEVDTFKPKGFILPSYESDTIALTTEQIDILQNIDLSHNLRLDNIRDLFIVGCSTGLRFNDLTTLSIDKIEGDFIRIKQNKTSERVSIPVSKRLQTILDKRDGKLPKGVTNQEFNRIIKEVAQYAGLTQTIAIKSNKGNINTIEHIETYKLISSHTARRTYATTMFKLGVRIMLIMGATGHKTESSFLKYIRATNEDKAQLLASELKKLGL